VTKFWGGSLGDLFNVCRRILYMITTILLSAFATPGKVARAAKSGGVVPIVA
jgi:hypothetical protein